MKKTYLFITDTDFKTGKLTGAHKRFLELVRGIGEKNKIILISHRIPQLQDVQGITFYEIGDCKIHIPIHIKGMIELCKKLVAVKGELKYDYAISFGPSNTICYSLCGYKNIVSLFREDAMEYLRAIGTPWFKIIYFRLQEYWAVRSSKKIIVQCENDKRNLIIRNHKWCHNIDKKIFIQINNVNASWMNIQLISREKDVDSALKVLFIGDFSNERKGHGILLPAISKLMEEFDDIVLYVAGDGAQLEEYKKKYKKYSKIIFLGRVNDIRKYLSLCDFEIVPSLVDSCPNTVLEGINAEIAVYGSNTGGIPDLLMKQEYLFEPKEEAIYSFLKNIYLQKRYIIDREKQKELKKILTFDWSKKIQDLIEE